MQMDVRKRKAVAPVIATLLMIAVAVAMSVIIFMWSQGFLSQTSSATGGQQGSQNQAAQSSISIEVATFVPTTSGVACATGATGTCVATIIVRNVGAVAVDMGALQVTGISSNAGFKGNLIQPSLASSSALVGGAAGNTVTSSSQTWYLKSDVATKGVAKGGEATFTLYVNTGTGTGTDTNMLSGDVINIKITTAVGTFAQSQFTVP